MPRPKKPTSGTPAQRGVQASAASRSGQLRGRPAKPETFATDEVLTIAAHKGKTKIQKFQFWLIGVTPLICHAWSEKARTEMLNKQMKITVEDKDPRNPAMEYALSLYQMPGGGYGFPSMAIKKSILSSAHKDKGLPRTSLMAALWIDGVMVKTQTAFSAASCNLPLLRVYGSEPTMREDMVRLSGQTANTAYRAEFENWALKVTGRLNVGLASLQQLATLIDESGLGIGIGDWRNERSGVFGSYRLAWPGEDAEWEAFAAGQGPLPLPEALAEAAE